MKTLTTVLALVLLAATVSYAETASEYRAGTLTYFENENYETVLPLAPVVVYAEFCEQLIADATKDLQFYTPLGGSMIISASPGGVATLITPVTDDQKCELSTPIIWAPGKYCAMEARVRMTNATTPTDATASIVIGFTDSQNEAASTLALSYSGTTLTSTASNCAMFFSDYDATTNYIRCVAVNADTDGTVTSTGTTIDDDTWYIYRIEINEDGDCDFWFNGSHIYQEEEGILTTATLCAYFGIQNRGSSGSNRGEIDYIRVWQER